MGRWSYCDLSEGVLRRWHGGLGVGWKDRQSEAQGSVLLTTPPTGPFLLTLTADHKLCSKVSPHRRLQHVIVRWDGLGPKRWLLEEGQSWDTSTGGGNMFKSQNKGRD